MGNIFIWHCRDNTGEKGKNITVKKMLLHIFLHLFFVTDVISAVLVYNSVWKNIFSRQISEKSKEFEAL